MEELPLLPYLVIYLIVYLHLYGLMAVMLYFMCYNRLLPLCVLLHAPDLATLPFQHMAVPQFKPDLSGPKVSSIFQNTNLPPCFPELAPTNPWHQQSLLGASSNEYALSSQSLLVHQATDASGPNIQPKAKDTLGAQRQFVALTPSLTLHRDGKRKVTVVHSSLQDILRTSRREELKSPNKKALRSWKS